MYLRKVKPAPCHPVSLEEARRSLAIDASSISEDDLLKLLIASATADAEMKTGRIFVESEWEWKPDDLKVGVDVEFPTCPVTKVQVFQGDDRLTDLSGDLFDIVYPSPEPQGTPMLGWLRLKSTFPEGAKILLTVGYPYSTFEEPVEQKDAPQLDVAKTGYSETKIHLVFNRPIQADVLPENFHVLLDGYEAVVDSVTPEKDGLSLVFVEPIMEGSTVTLSFFEGAIYDQFSNFVQPISDAVLPDVVLQDEGTFQEPDAIPVEMTYESHCPSPVKEWILVRTGTLYSQRTEIALRAGKSNDALYPDGFINNLLNPYRTRFA